MIETLEPRIAPATLTGRAIVTYLDADGDLVTLKFSKALFTDLVTANQILQFDSGSVDGDNSIPQKLRLVDLSNNSVAPLAKGLWISLSAKRSGSGDGLADVAYIKATGIDLGRINVSGDLGGTDDG